MANTEIDLFKELLPEGIDLTAKSEDNSQNPTESEWLLQVISPERVAGIKNFMGPEYSDAWIILHAVQGEWSQVFPLEKPLETEQLERIHNLTIALRVLLHPYQNFMEQFLAESFATRTNFIHWSQEKVEVTPELKSDVRFIWRTFNLKPPSQQLPGFTENPQLP